MINQINSTRFYVYSDYAYFINANIAEEAKFIELIQANSMNQTSLSPIISILSLNTLKEESFYYDPLTDAQGLFTELMKLPTIWDENLEWNKRYKISALTDFLHAYGLPLGEGIFNERFEWKGSTTMNFYEFNRELFEYQQAFNIWLAIKHNKASKIKTYAKEYDSKYMIHHKWNAPPLNDKNKASYLLSIILEKKSKGNYTYKISNGKPNEIYTFSNLFEVAYFQLSNSIKNEMNFKTCKNCGHLFHETHKSRLFCHNSPKSNISACANSYKQRVQRDKAKAIKLAKEGVDVREILKNINSKRDIYSKRTMNEILKWTK